MHNFETIMRAVEKQFNRISGTEVISTIALMKLSLDGYMSIADPKTSDDAMAVVASFHIYRHRLSQDAFNFYARYMRSVMAMYSGLRKWRLVHYAVPEVLDSPATALRSAALCGTWLQTETYRSGSFGYNSFGKMILYSNGRFHKSANSYASDTYRYSDGQYKGSSSFHSGGNTTEGYWGNSFDDFYLAYPADRTFHSYDCRLNQQRILILTDNAGNEQIWEK